MIINLIQLEQIINYPLGREINLMELNHSKILNLHEKSENLRTIFHLNF